MQKNITSILPSILSAVSISGNSEHFETTTTSSDRELEIERNARDARHAGRCRQNEIIRTLPPLIRNSYKRDYVVHSVPSVVFQLTEDSVDFTRGNTSKMRCILAVVFAAVLIAAEGKVLPASDVENQQTATHTPQLTDYIREAQTKISELGTQITQSLNLPNHDEFLNTLKEQSNNFTNNVQQYIQTMTEEVSENILVSQSIFHALRLHRVISSRRRIRSVWLITATKVSPFVTLRLK